MQDENTQDILAELDKLLSTPKQSWLLASGICVDANIPIMVPLTKRVLDLAGAHVLDKKLVTHLNASLPDDTTIEDTLSHLADHIAIAVRSKDNTSVIGAEQFSLSDMEKVHDRLLMSIAETIRWGYVPADSNETEKIGDYNNPLVTVDGHQQFISALMDRNRAGVGNRRPPINLFTTNYDTLIEDALALNRISYWDGFSGGAVAYRSHVYGDKYPERNYQAHVVKLHGSIDWRAGDDDRLVRVRDKDMYPEGFDRVLIYPQSTKYLATQRDPFAAQFELLRNSLGEAESVFGICGYGFYDNHINDEIALSMGRAGSNTTLLVFTKEIPEALAKWQAESWSNRLYIISEQGIYVGADGPHTPSDTAAMLDWWKFDGLTRILTDGAVGYVG